MAVSCEVGLVDFKRIRKRTKGDDVNEEKKKRRRNLCKIQKDVHTEKVLSFE